MKNKHYTYIHIKPNYEVFYVGMGCNKRAWKKVSRNKFWHNIVNKYGYKVIITDYYDTSEEAGIAEIEMIAEYRSLGCNLVNQTDGGDGGSTGRVWQESTRKKLRECGKGEKNGMFSKHHTDDARKIISEANTGEGNGFYGKSHSDVTRAKMKAAWEKRRLVGVSDATRKKLSIARSGAGNANYGKKHSDETKEKMRIKASLRTHTEETKNKISASQEGLKRGKYKKRKLNISTELS